MALHPVSSARAAVAPGRANGSWRPIGGGAGAAGIGTIVGADGAMPTTGGGSGAGAGGPVGPGAGGSHAAAVRMRLNTSNRFLVSGLMAGSFLWGVDSPIRLNQ